MQTAKDQGTAADRFRVRRAIDSVGRALPTNIGLLARAAGPFSIVLYPKGPGFNISFDVPVTAVGSEPSEMTEERMQRLTDAVCSRMESDLPLIARAWKIVLSVEPRGSDFDVQLQVRSR